MDAMTGTPWELKAPQIVGMYPSRSVLYFFVYCAHSTFDVSRRYPPHWSAQRVGYTQGPHSAFGRKIDCPRKF